MKNRWISKIIIGFAIGLIIGIGLKYLNISSDDLSIQSASQSEQLDFAVLISQAYMTTGDWDTLQKRLSILEIENPQDFIIRVTEFAIISERETDEICPLIHVSRMYGYLTDAMVSYPGCEG